MEIFAAVIAWLALGLIGSALLGEFAFRRSRSFPLDIYPIDIAFLLALSVVGPITLVVGAVWSIFWMLGGLFDSNRVIFKAHR